MRLNVLSPSVVLLLGVMTLLFFRFFILASNHQDLESDSRTTAKASNDNKQVIQRDIEHFTDDIAYFVDNIDDASIIDSSTTDTSFKAEGSEQSQQSASRKDVIFELFDIEDNLDTQPYRSINRIIEISRKDLGSTLDWIAKLDMEFQGHFYQAVLHDALHQSGDENIPLLMEHVSLLPLDTVNRGKLIADVSQRAALDDVELAIEWLNDMGQDPVVHAAKSALLSQWAQRSPQQVFSYLSSSSHGDRSSNTTIIQNAIASLSTNEAIQVMEQFTDYGEAVQRVLVESVVSNLVRQSPESIEAWFSRQSPSAVKDAALLSYLRQSASSLSEYDKQQYIEQLNHPDATSLFE